jgi:copper resistance protein B
MKMRINLKTAVLIMAMLPISSFAAGLDDDPLLTYFKADEFGWRDTDEGTSFVWEFDAWMGKDLDKLRVKSAGERFKGETEASETELLYSIGVSSFWDLQLGWRHESEPDWSDNSLGAGFLGTAPYQFEVDTSLFVNDDDLFNARVEIEYEYLFSQKLVLIPTLELSLYSDDDVARGIGSGLSDVELGLRLHYELRREFAPYIGINYEKKFGNSADFLSAAGQEVSDTQVMAGVSFWF